MVILPLLASFVLCPPPQGQSASGKATVGQPIAFQGERPVVKEGIAYLSSETCAILFDADSVWSPKRQEVTFSTAGHKVVLHVGESKMTVDGRTVEFSGKPYLQGEDAMVPVEAVAKGLSANLCITIRTSETKNVVVARPVQTVEIRTFGSSVAAGSKQDE